MYTIINNLLWTNVRHFPKQRTLNVTFLDYYNDWLLDYCLVCGLPCGGSGVGRISWPSLASSPPKSQAGYDSLVRTRISADWRLSGTLRYRRQETSPVGSHRVTSCTKDNDHAGDEKFRGCGPIIWNSLPAVWRSLDFWRPTYLADRQHVWGLFMTALQIQSSSSSSSAKLFNVEPG